MRRRFSDNVPQDVLDRLEEAVKNPQPIIKRYIEPVIITCPEHYKRVIDFNATEIEHRGFDARLIHYTLAGEALERREFIDELKKLVDNNGQSSGQ